MTLKQKIQNIIKQKANCDVDCDDDGTCCCYLKNPDQLTNEILEVLKKDIIKSHKHFKEKMEIVKDEQLRKIEQEFFREEIK